MRRSSRRAQRERRIRSLPALILTLALALMASDASGESEAGRPDLDALERRVAQLESERSRGGDPLASWTERVRLGGHASTGWFGGQRFSPLHERDFLVWDARLFVDAELGGPVRLFDTTIVRHVGMSFEWNLVRLGMLFNDVGELYADFQGILGSGWLNLQLGRFQLPVGESYLRYSKGAYTNPFISNTVGGPWWWDEGVKLYGASEGGLFSYVASISTNETAFDASVNSQKQYTLKLILDPLDWLHLSASGLYAGAVGSNASPGSGAALWLGETWAKKFYPNPAVPGMVPTYFEGQIVGPGPNRIDGGWLLGGDAIVTLTEKLRLWLAYGYYDMDQAGQLYDRRFHYWIAELVLDGALLTPELRDLYLGLRANGVGSYDDGRGYSLDFRQEGKLGFNASSLTDYSVVLGWHMLESVSLKAEYTHRVIDMVRGVSPLIELQASDVDSWGIEVGIHF